MTDYEALRLLAIDVAHEAATLIRRERAEGVEVADTKSSLTDVVTAVDRASESLIRERLLQARPGDGFLGEEGGDVAGEGVVRWIVDPIDGTVNFLYGLGEYAVSIAAEVEGTVVAGTVLNVATGVCYSGSLGGGSWRDDVALRVRGPAPVAQRLVLTGFSYLLPVRTLQGQAVARLLTLVRDIRRVGSAALDLCRVAEGAADAYVEEGVQLWDYAAGLLIAREAGARSVLLTGAGGLDLLVCAPAHGFEEFVTAITESGFVGGE